MQPGPLGVKNTISQAAVDEALDRPQKTARISVIIPTMNEPAISRVINETKQALKHFETEVVVVDKSTDDTARKARKAGAVVITQEDVGYGNAYTVGFNNISHDTDIVVMMDGDYTYDPYEIPALIEPIVNGKADMVLGNRFAGMEDGAMTARNRLGNRIITRFINILYRLRLKDTQTGFRAIRASALRGLEFTSDGMPFASEMIIDARKKSLGILEVPIRYRQRVGEAKLKAYKDGSLIISLIIRMVRDYNPLVIFMPIGVLLILAGLALGSYVIYLYMITSRVDRIASTILSAFLIMTGLQIILFSLMTDILLVALRSRR